MQRHGATVIWDLRRGRCTLLRMRLDSSITLILSSAQRTHFLSDVFEWESSKKVGAQPTSGKRLLGLWDGGAFQLLLPQLLLDEAHYSSQLRDMMENYAHFTIEHGKQNSLNLPACHSAAQFAAEGVAGADCDNGFPCYNGKAGTVELAASINQDVHDQALRAYWDLSFTPHAAFLAASVRPDLYAGILARAETLEGQTAGATNLLYHADYGWMDGYFVRGVRRGQVVPVILSLDQGIIALAAINAAGAGASSSGVPSLSARALVA